MSPEARILRIVKPENGGPRARAVLAGIAEAAGAKDGEAVVKGMLKAGRLRLVGSKRGCRYALPLVRRANTR